jgi:hypothetical protein
MRYCKAMVQNSFTSTHVGDPKTVKKQSSEDSAKIDRGISISKKVKEVTDSGVSIFFSKVI